MKTISLATGAGIGILILVLVGFSIYWSSAPDSFEPSQYAADHAAKAGWEPVPGYTVTATVAHLAETMLDKPGGFLANDYAPPGVWLDNMPNFETGVIFQIRDMARVLRNDWSRSQSQSQEDEDLVAAQGKFFIDTENWIFPASEDEYRDGIKHLHGYLSRIADPSAQGAQFYARADNLNEWLGEVEKRLGDLAQQLSLSVGKHQLNLDLAGDSGSSRSTSTPDESYMKTGWTERDDVFYEARGQCWALLHLLKAVEQDFGDVLDKKNARVSLRQIIRELEPTQDTVWSPMILNGDGLGLLANHSVYMASYISRANSAIIQLRELMANG